MAAEGCPIVWAGEYRSGERCNRPSHTKAGLCVLHYGRAKTGAVMDAKPHRRIRDDDICTHVWAGDWRRGERCDRARHTRAGLCALHSGRRRTGADMDMRPQTGYLSRGQCTHVWRGLWRQGERCDRRAMSGSLCAMHLSRERQGARMDEQPVGEGIRKHLNTEGYIVCSEDGNRWLEHRRAVEELIGRPLEPDEIVRHRNGIRSDNRLSNLELCVKSQPPGRRVSDQVVWAVGCLREYGAYFGVAVLAAEQLPLFPDDAEAVRALVRMPPR